MFYKLSTFQGKDGNSSDPISSAPAVGGSMLGIKAVDQASALEQGVYYPTTNFYDYYYTGKYWFIHNI